MVNTLYHGPLVTPLKELAGNDPHKAVFIDGERKLTAAQLFANSQAAAASLLREGLKTETTVVMAVAPGLEFLELIYALLMLRARIAIIDPEMGRENYVAKIRQLSPEFMFVDSRLLLMDEWPLLKKAILKIKKNVPDLSFHFPSKMIKTGPDLPIRKEHIAYRDLLQNPEKLNGISSTDTSEAIIVYTSGTLQVPKGVLHSDKSLSTTIGLLKEILGAEKNDVVGTYLPHFMLLGIASGLVVKIMPTRMKAKKKLDWIKNQEINILFGPPSEWLPLVIHCERTGTTFPGSLKHLMLGSAPVHQGFLKRLVNVLPTHTKITCTYGMTEHLLVAIADGRKKTGYNGEGDLLGTILPGVEVRISDEKEIIVRSEQLFSRYLHQESGEEWHSTGDLGKIDENGDLVLLGRKKEMIIRKDFNIYPALYEGTIKKIPGINEAAFIGIYDEAIQDEKVYLALETDRSDLQEIEKLLRKGIHSIDRQALPDKIFRMVIPRKGRQDKIDRQRIVEHIRSEKL